MVPVGDRVRVLALVVAKAVHQINLTKTVKAKAKAAHQTNLTAKETKAAKAKVTNLEAVTVAKRYPDLHHHHLRPRRSMLQAAPAHRRAAHLQAALAHPFQ